MENTIGITLETGVGVQSAIDTTRLPAFRVLGFVSSLPHNKKKRETEIVQLLLLKHHIFEGRTY